MMRIPNSYIWADEKDGGVPCETYREYRRYWGYRKEMKDASSSSISKP
jgi:hypothetical protein